jgi:hypothetical protein
MRLGRLELGFCIQKHLPLWFPIAGFVDRVPMIKTVKPQQSD